MKIASEDKDRERDDMSESHGSWEKCEQKNNMFIFMEDERKRQLGNGVFAGKKGGDVGTGGFYRT